MDIFNLNKCNDGRKIKQATQLIKDELSFYIPKENQKMFYVEDYRGEYGMFWIICFDENEKELYRVSDKYITSIEWSD